MQKNVQTYLKHHLVFTSQDFKSMFDHFCTFRRKGLNYNFQEYFKGCKTLTLRNVETLQSKQNLYKVWKSLCLEIVISKN